MLTKHKKFISLLLAILLLTAYVPVVTTAAPHDQIVTQGSTRYYDKDGNLVTASPVLGGNAVVSVSKTIAETGIENEFEVTAEVKTSVDISNVKVSADAAVVLVLDISGSMGTPVNHMPTLKTAAKNFVTNFFNDAGDAARYISLVSFETDGFIELGWTDVSTLQGRNDIINKIDLLYAYGSTNMEAGLRLARNLLRKEALPNGKDGKPIENRSVILFSDGAANLETTALGRAVINFATGTRITGGGYQYDYDNNPARTAAANIANVIKNDTSFLQGSYHEKYDAYLFTIAFGSGAPTTWLRDTVATNATFAYTAANAGDLNNVFAAIVERIESWAQAWVVTDPMGQNIEFLTTIAPNDKLSGLLDYSNGILSWDLKKATPNSFLNNIYTYTYTYRIRLDTTSSSYTPNTPYPTNGKTELTYVMVVDDKIASDVMIATFDVPAVKGFSPGSFSFNKVGGGNTILPGCAFEIRNNTKTGWYAMASSGVGTGTVSFANLPSGYKYTLKETSMPGAFEGLFQKSDETYTVTVSYGDVIIQDGKGDTVSNGFTFNNPLYGRKLTGLVSPMVTRDDLGTGFLQGHDTVVELRPTFLTPADPEFKTTAVRIGTTTDGRFTFEDVPCGTYVLAIKRPGYLLRCMNVTVRATDPNVIELTPIGAEDKFNLWPGDANNDYVIDGRDILYMMDYYNYTAFDAQYRSECDFNGDGVIDVRDTLVLYDYINKTILDYPGADDIDMYN